MNREIKFRAWDKKLNRWYKPVYEAYNDNVHDISITMRGQILTRTLEEPASLVDHQDGRYKLNQFTGLKDKNEKDIFEGDIIKGPTRTTVTGRGYKSTRTKEVVFQVKSTMGHWGHAFTIEGDYDNNYRGMPRFDECEVIGNIYENPELLEDK